MSFKIVIEGDDKGEVHMEATGFCFEINGALLWALSSRMMLGTTKQNEVAKDAPDPKKE